VLPDDGPVGPKHVGVTLKLILICVEGFKVYKILRQYIGANSWFYNFYNMKLHLFCVKRPSDYVFNVRSLPRCDALSTGVSYYGVV
jgi:hypothetical protein